MVSGKEDKLRLFNGNKCRGDPIWVLNHTTMPPKPTLLKASAVSIDIIKFTDAEVYENPSRFRLLFSFHNESSQLEKLPGGKWNCSVPHWSDFHQHFPCNLEPECAGGQDEVQCPYTTDTCGQGRLTINGSCYIYVTPSRDVSWNEAAQICSRKDAQLGSLNTVEEWENVMEILTLSDYKYVFTSLRLVRGLKGSSHPNVL